MGEQMATSLEAARLIVDGKRPDASAETGEEPEEQTVGHSSHSY